MSYKKIFSLLFIILFTNNIFGQDYEDAINPNWSKSVPEIIYPDSELVKLYQTTWQIAAGRVRKGPEGLAASPYLDENCYDDQIWIWDTAFMSLFTKYSPSTFPGLESLQNIYKPLHDGAASPLRIHMRDNPPIMAWAEWENFKVSGNKAHVRKLLYEQKYLQLHFNYFNSVEKGNYNPKLSPNKIFRDVVRHNGKIIGYTWSTRGAGMDNTVRGRDVGGSDSILWVDAISQQALSALCISRLFSAIGANDSAKTWFKRYNEIKKTIRKLYWDEKDGTFYDISIHNGKPCRILTPASFWTMIAGIPTKKEAKRMIIALRDSMQIGGSRPWNSLSRKDKDFDSATGDYWRGGIWFPVAYMGTKAIEDYGFTSLADSIAERLVQLQKRTYTSVSPNTIWECYSPSADEPSTECGERCRPNFCGWSALGPISLFIENVIGIAKMDCTQNSITWRLKQDKGSQGLKKLHFNGNVIDLIYNKEKNAIETKASKPFLLILNGKKHKVEKGEGFIKMN